MRPFRLTFESVRNNYKPLKKSNVCCTRGVTPKHITSGWARTLDLAPEQHSSQKTPRRWRAVGGLTMSLALRDEIFRFDWNQACYVGIALMMTFSFDYKV